MRADGWPDLLREKRGGVNIWVGTCTVRVCAPATFCFAMGLGDLPFRPPLFLWQAALKMLGRLWNWRLSHSRKLERQPLMTGVEIESTGRYQSGGSERRAVIGRIDTLNESYTDSDAGLESTGSFVNLEEVQRRKLLRMAAEQKSTVVPPKMLEVLSGLMLGMYIFAFCNVYAFAVFTDHPFLRKHLRAAIQMNLVTAIMMCSVYTRYSKIGVSIGTPDINPTIIHVQIAEYLARPLPSCLLPTSNAGSAFLPPYVPTLPLICTAQSVSAGVLLSDAPASTPVKRQNGSTHWLHGPKL